MKDKSNEYGLCEWFIFNWKRLTGKISRTSEDMVIKDHRVNHNVRPKQAIRSDSPLKEEQSRFIDEGGNSQSLKK